MNESQAAHAVDEINILLQKKPWLDFEIMAYQGTTLVVMGSIDASAPHDVEIHFGGVFFMSLPMEWKTDTSTPPLSVVSGEDAVKLNRRFQVEQGHHIFRFAPEGYPKDFGCLVCAREVSLKDMKSDT